MTDWRAGAKILGEYTIKKELGRGGMGRVWLVRSQSTGRRFAVKQALIRDEKHRKAFLTELRTWIDLPEHPNIVPCRFFRTVGEEIVIFADYVDGGSLADWIVKGKLTSTKQILDVAIQFAWGLHAMHERGLIHQDVKPGNVLMTADGVAMVTDFGLARARLRADDGAFVSPALPPGEQSVLVSVGGMTPAYASPEQRAGQPLSRKTDIWSWGVSVLDMLVGGVSCPHGGQIAADVLEDLVGDEHPSSDLRRAPSQLIIILRRCFSRNVAERWGDMGCVATEVESLYANLTGAVRQRARASSSLLRAGPHDRLSTLGVSWDDPKTWLLRALQLAGHDVAEADQVTEELSASKLGRAAHDLAYYDRALSVLEEAAAAGIRGSDRCFAELCIQKALVHEYCGDFHGALALVQRAAATYESLLHRHWQPGLAVALACVFNFTALLVQKAGDKAKALAAYDNAIACLGRFDSKAADAEYSRTLANVMMNRAIALSDTGRPKDAVRDYGLVIEICRPLVEKQHDVQAVDVLGAAHLNLGSLLQDLGDDEEAERSFDAAIAIRESQISDNGDANPLANAYLAKAKQIRRRGRNTEGTVLWEKGIALRRACVDEGRHELLPLLAEDYLNECAALSGGGRARAAQVMADKAVAILDDAVNNQGRPDLAANLANAHVNAACALANIRDFLSASKHIEPAIRIYQQLCDSGRAAKSDELANALKMRQQLAQDTRRQEADKWAAEALALREKGQVSDSLVHYRKALQLDPNDADIWVNYGAACGAAGDDRGALEAFDRAAVLVPDNATAWHNKGAVLFQQERYEDALPALEKAYALGHQSSMNAVAKCRGMLRRLAREKRQ